MDTDMDLDIAALVQPHQVHRDIYLDPGIFAREMRSLWARSWLFVGHDSQVPQAGDYITTQLADQPVLMLRREDGQIGVLLNRCAHKGSTLCTQASGHAGRFLRCPYHGWSYRLDGSLLGLPLKAGYAGADFAQAPAQRGLTPYGEVAVHRGFVFARAQAPQPARAGGAAAAPDFQASLGPLLGLLDLLADRSPLGRLQVAGGIIRTQVRANWKIYLENINDAVHPVTTHASATQSAQAVWAQQPADAVKPAALQQLLPFGSGYEFFDRMGARLLPGGHTVLGTQASLHAAYAELPGYAEALATAHGPQRAREVLAFAPQNVVFYPGMALKGVPQVMRVIRPLAVDHTVVEAWAFQPAGAPAALLESALLYNRQVFSPLSPVAHDDLHLFEGLQRGLAARGNPWVSLHRGAGVGAVMAAKASDAPGASDASGLPREVSGTDEALLRHQYQAWAALMTEERPQADDIRRPPPEGVEQSGRATFPQEAAEEAHGEGAGPQARQAAAGRLAG